MTSDALFKALGDPTRRALFERLMAQEVAVGELPTALGVSQPAVSQHLAVLRDAKLVTMRQVGRNRFYRARPEGLVPLFDWLAYYQQFWPQKLDKLKTVLGRKGKGRRPMSEETRSIEVDYELPDSPEDVWRALTDAKLLGEWLMTNDIRPVVGHTFTFQGKPIPGVWDGRTECEVLAVEPLRLIRYTWRGGSNESPGGQLDSIVTWTLAPGPNGGTKLHLSHSGFTSANQFSFDTMGKGWRGFVAERIGKTLAETRAT